MEVTCGAAGTLTLTNAIENRTTTVENCVANEKITFAYPVISSSSSGHTTLLNVFNYIFPRVANTSSSKVNSITASMVCTVVIIYNPIIKIAV